MGGKGASFRAACRTQTESLQLCVHSDGAHKFLCVYVKISSLSNNFGIFLCREEDIFTPEQEKGTGVNDHSSNLSWTGLKVSPCTCARVNSCLWTDPSRKPQNKWPKMLKQLRVHRQRGQSTDPLLHPENLSLRFGSCRYLCTFTAVATCLRVLRQSNAPDHVTWAATDPVQLLSRNRHTAAGALNT